MLEQKDCRELHLLMEDLRAGRSTELGADKIRSRWKGLSSFEKLLGIVEPLPIILDGDNVVVRPFEQKSFLKTKLLLPDNAKSNSLSDLYTEHPLQGIVLNVGSGWMLDSGLYRMSNYQPYDHVLVDQARASMVQDFIIHGIVYYKVPSSIIVAKALSDYSKALENLEFITK